MEIGRGHLHARQLRDVEGQRLRIIIVPVARDYASKMSQDHGTRASAMKIRGSRDVESWT